MRVDSGSELSRFYKMFHFVESGVTADYGAITPSPCWVLFFAFIWRLGLQPHTNELKASVYWEVLDKLLSEKGKWIVYFFGR